MNGVELIAAERRRQMAAEGWTANHDDAHDNGELGEAGVAYAAVADAQIKGVDEDELGCCEPDDFGWPWEPSAWKPSADPVRNLVKAGALIAAEIDRLQRRAAADPQPLTSTGEQK